MHDTGKDLPPRSLGERGVTQPEVRPIDRAVWSFWSRPFAGHYHSNWASEQFHLLSWVLSFQTTRCHFRETSLVTDNDGAKLLADRLQLPFDYVTTDLEGLSESDPRWWIRGKLHTYRMQDKPFIHFDSDVYLWKPLPTDCLTADVIAQNPEYATISDATCYKPSAFTKQLLARGGWLPPEWLAYVRGGGGTAICTGLFGGCDIDALRRYADRAISIIERRDNRAIWQQENVGIGHQILVEQYYLGAFCADLTGELDHRLRVRYLFESMGEAFDPAASTRVGYTHLIANAKKNRTLAQLVAERVQRDYPDYYERCLY